MRRKRFQGLSQLLQAHLELHGEATAGGGRLRARPHLPHPRLKDRHPVPAGPHGLDEPKQNTPNL